MIAIDMQPTSIVEDRGFQKFVSSLDPRYHPPSRKTIAHTLLPQKYEEVAKKVRAGLDMVEYVATTTDIWTSVQTKGYITLTSHYITPFWELKSPVLATVQLTSKHTAINIASELEKLANEWEIKDKVVSIITDNAANMIAATRVCGWTHLSCFAHTLNLVVTDAIKADDDLMRVQQKAKNVVSFFNHSPKATDRLCDVQKQLSLPPHKLIQDVATRWNLTYFMFERIIEQFESVTTVLCLIGRNDICLTNKELAVTKKAVCALKPFFVATEEMSTEKHVGVSKVCIIPCNQKFIQVNLFQLMI
jgi:hypothetical protein